MSILARDVLKVYQPFWANGSSSAWLNSEETPSAIGAGVVFQTVVPHPYASIGEQYVEIKCNNADHRFIIKTPGGIGGAFFTGAHRWAGMASWLGQFTATNPAADTIIWDNDSSGSIIGTADYRKLVWVAGTKTVAYYTGATPTLQATSTLTLPATTNVRVEVWEMFEDATGAALAANQVVVRYIDLTTFAATTLINTTMTGITGQRTLNAIACFGSKSADANDARFYFGNVFCSMQDADAPYGNIRVDRLDPTGSGHDTAWLNDFTKVNESGTSVPDATADTVTYQTNSTKKQTYATANPTLAALGDTIVCVQVSEQVKYSGTLDKGSSQNVVTLLSDGTTDVTGTGPAVLSTAYKSIVAPHIDKPGGTGWTFGDLAGVEVGHQASNTTTGSPITYYNTTCTTLVAYVKSGEGTAAIDAIPAVGGTTRNSVMML